MSSTNNDSDDAATIAIRAAALVTTVACAVGKQFDLYVQQHGIRKLITDKASVHITNSATMAVGDYATLVNRVFSECLVRDILDDSYNTDINEVVDIATAAYIEILGDDTENVRIHMFTLITDYFSGRQEAFEQAERDMFKKKYSPSIL